MRPRTDVSDESVTVSQHQPAGQVQPWGSLEILEQVGQGGFGVVYRAWEPALAREVALKIIRPHDPRPEALAAILREGQLLARVRHPNVVTVYGAQRIGDEVGLWMEFVRGRSLADLVKQDGPRAAGEAAVVGISLCQATAAVHQAGVIHRDIKAHNVMREAGGRIVLMDFGAGQLLDGPRHPDEPSTGTPAYMAPEVLAGARANVRSDVYSLGVLLYYLVAGTYPVEGHSWTDYLLAHARFERRPLGDVRPDINPSFVRAVERATALNPDDRYATPGAMLTDLSAIAGGGGAAIRPRRTGHTDSRRRRVVPVRHEPQPAKSRWIRAAIYAGPVLVPLVLGTVTSVVFNFTLRRPLEFSNENGFQWFVWGLRALVPGAVQAIIVVLLWSLVAAIWKLLIRVSAPVAGFAEALRARRRSFAARLGLDEPEAAAQALLAAQILGLVIFCWYFRDIFSAAISFIDEATDAQVEPFRPDHLFHHQLYNTVMSMMILAMGVATYHIAGLHKRAQTKPSASLGLVVSVIGISLVLLVFPYRLIWQNLFEVATHDGDHCYILGQKEAEALLYCPAIAEPKVRRITLPDAALKPSGVRQSIYTR